MRSSLFLLCLPALAAACGSGAAPEPAQATGSSVDPLARMRPHLPFRTLTMSVHRGVFRVDAENRYLTYDFEVGDVSKGKLREELRISWDGQKLYLASSRGALIELPSLYASRVGEVLDELQAGAPNLQFTEDTPASVSPGWKNPLRHVWQGEWYRVDTPWSWDDAYSLYVHANPSAYLQSFIVIDHATGEPLHVYRDYDLSLVSFRTNAMAWNLPLHQDIQSTETPPRGYTQRLHWKHKHFSASTHPPHHRAVRMVRMELTSGDAMDTIKSTCATGQGVSEPFQSVWTVPQDAETLARLEAARQTCTKMRFSMAMSARLGAGGQGQRSCYSGTWTVWNDHAQPPTQLWSDAVSGCVQDNGFDIDPYEWKQDMPLTAPLQHLRVTFDGQLSIQCQSTTDKWANAGINLTSPKPVNPPNDVKGIPTLEWNCWPGWDMTGVYSKRFPEYQDFSVQ